MDLKLELSQKLALSQNMVLSAQILQMSNAELVEYLKELSVENPVVECDEQKNDDKFENVKEKLEWLGSSDFQNNVYYNDDEKDREDWNYKEIPGESLEEYLLSQLNVLNLQREVYVLAKYIIQNMDNNGYVRESADDLYSIFKPFNIDKKCITDAFSIIQSFEPLGVGASNLSECLLIQLKARENRNPIAEAIVEKELENLGKNKIAIIAKNLKVSVEDVISAVSVIKSLNPKPGNSFMSDRNLNYIVPDVIVEETSDGDFNIIIDDTYFPNIRIGRQYKDILSTNVPDEAKEYVCKKVKQAEWIIKCVSKRHETLMKTMEVIVDTQKEFFSKNSGELKPMRLIDVAEKIEVHESTVSRAIKDKYVQCSHGVYPLSRFFCNGIASKNSNSKDDMTTADAIKSRITKIIEGEDKKSPLSDRVITEMLNDEGVAISRRTVAKYRESMGIAGASGRKQY